MEALVLLLAAERDQALIQKERAERPEGAPMWLEWLILVGFLVIVGIYGVLRKGDGSPEL